MAVAAWATTHPNIPPPDMALCQPQERTIGNDVTRLNDRLNHVTMNLEVVLNRLRGAVPVQGKPPCPDMNVSLRDRLGTANENVDIAGKQVQEILSLLGE